jgi:hypothetical protein
VEPKSFQCQTRLCIGNHFQGLVSCPYGQNATGDCPYGEAQGSCAATGQTGCLTPGIKQPVDGKDPSTGMYIDPKQQATVLPQCLDRTADKAVYCSCRCANINGQTNDGANYCTCPSGFSCTQVVSSVSDQLDQGLTGGYCIKNGTQFDPNTFPTGGNCPACEASSGNCGNAQGVKPQ